MAAVAHSPSFAKKVEIKQSVGKEFMSADKGKKFAGGGQMAAKKLFGGKETRAEEMKEAKALKSGKHWDPVLAIPLQNGRALLRWPLALDNDKVFFCIILVDCRILTASTEVFSGSSGTGQISEHLQILSHRIIV